MYRTAALFSAIALACCGGLSGCSADPSATLSQSVTKSNQTTNSTTPAQSPATTSTATSSGSSITWIPEPGSAAEPWVSAIDSAKSTVYLNEYLVTDKPIVEALISAANRGLDVKVIADAHPYGDSSAVPDERAEFAKTRVHLKLWSPSAYSFDHAKYLAVDGRTAIIGSANADYSAMEGGSNLEGDVFVKGGAVPMALSKLFTADWAGASVPSPKYPLIVSPGSESAILSLLNQTGMVSVASEELGSDSAILQAMEQKGKELHLLLPTSMSSSDMNNARALAAHGVQVRMLKVPYVHAKVILSGSKLFVGSENLTATSLNENREVGIVVTDKSVVHQATTWFSTYWTKATALNATHIAATKTTTGSYPYLDLGVTESQVKAKWGAPSSVSHTTYHGAPETVWHYSNGDACYFSSSGRLVYVKR